MTTVHPDGTREVFGLVSMKLPPAIPTGRSAGETIEVSTVGFLVFSSPVGSGIALGYAREQVTGLKNNALVIGAPNGMLGARAGHGDTAPAASDVEQIVKGVK